MTYFIERQKFHVPFSAGDWRFDDIHNLEPESARGIVHFLNRAQPLRFVANNSAAAHFPSSDLKLWLNECDDRTVRRELTAGGWRVIVVWECRLQSKGRLEQVAQRIARRVRTHSYPP